MKILGIDNVLFYVGNLTEAVTHYTQLGFHLRFHLEAKQLALFEIGSERPGLILKQSAKEHLNSKGCFWVEVSDASRVAKELQGAGIHELGPLLETATGFTVEVTDLWGNIVGFADYHKRPDMARSFE